MQDEPPKLLGVVPSDNEEFRRRFSDEVKDINAGQSQTPEIYARYLEKALIRLNTLIEPLAVADVQIRDELEFLISKVVSLSMLLGSIGPLSTFVKDVVKAPYKAGSKAGGERSGQSRREERETTWEPHAKDLAIECRASDPKSSQDDVAHYIIREWKLAAGLRQKHSTFKKMIGRMEATGELSRRST